ncbi:MAG: copper uptake system-associated protein [Burkholderiales bacterium]|nr:copper uptake system-associated protein [Burkholderiales bacterium]
MLKLLLALLMTFNLTTTFANPFDDQQVIRQLMKQGGRALLKRDAKKWEIVLCAGEGLTQPAVLKQAGLDAPLASSLSKKITAAELKSSAELRKKFSLFKGEVWSHQHHQAH